MCLKPVHVNGNMVKCRKCPECIVQRKNEWIWRIMQEDKRAINSLFLTFTYDEENCPTQVNKETGEILRSLRKKDLQDYWKRLRKNNPKAVIKYYAVGEYGSEPRKLPNGKMSLGLRPHYHAIIFGISREEVEKHWKHGNAFTGTVQTQSVRYVVKYMSKRLKNTPKGAQKPNCSMSRNIGADWIKKNRTFIQSNKQTTVRDGKLNIPIPKTWLEKIYTDPDELDTILKNKKELRDQKDNEFWDSFDREEDKDHEYYLQDIEKRNKYNVGMYQQGNFQKCTTI